MARPKELIDEALVEKASKELEKIKNYKVCIRLKAIMSCKDHSISHVSTIMGVNRSSLWTWIRRFREGSVSALFDKPKGHNPSKLAEHHKREVSIWLKERRDVKGKPVHWTLEKLRLEIEAGHLKEKSLTRKLNQAIRIFMFMRAFRRTRENYLA